MALPRPPSPARPCLAQRGRAARLALGDQRLSGDGKQSHPSRPPPHLALWVPAPYLHRKVPGRTRRGWGGGGGETWEGVGAALRAWPKLP